MKKEIVMLKRFFITVLFAVLFLIPSTTVFAETLLQQVDFETPAGYTASPAESNANTSDPDYWIRTNGTTPVIYSSNTFTTSDGSYFFAAEDLDNVAAGSYTVTCDAISVNGYSDLQIKFLVGGRSDAGIEGEEYIKIQYNMDGGGWVTRAQFIGNQISPFLQYYEDANADGTVDGPSINETLSEFTYSLPVTGSSLQVRIEVYNGGGEEVAFDNIRVLGTVAGPLEPPIWVYLDPIKIIGNDVHLEWNAVDGATSYPIYRSEDPYTGFTQIGVAYTTYYIDEGVVETGKKYFYLLIADNAKK
jgi:hypothetical protein